MFQVEEVEGFNIQNIEGMRDREVPACKRGSKHSHPIGPVNKDDYLTKLKRDNYILKSKIVSPVCPKNPYDIPETDWKKEHEDLHKKEREEREELRKKENENKGSNSPAPNMDVSSNKLTYSSYSSQDTNSSNTNNPNTNKPNTDVSSNNLSNSNNLYNINYPSKSTKSSDTKQDNSKSNTSGQSNNQAPTFFNSNTMMNNNSLLSKPEKKNVPEPAKAEDKKSEPQDLSKCPPCPACERCPEPTVDCKKVVKYKDKSYPVPVISDFSHFSRF